MKFSNLDLSILGEVGNVSVGGAAASLSDFVNQLVTISIPTTKILTFGDLKKEFEPEVVYSKIDYSKGLKGSNMLLLKKNEAYDLAKLVGKQKLDIEIDKWDDFSKNIISEIFNIMAGNMSSSMSSVLNRDIKILTPEMSENTSLLIKEFKDEDEIITIWFEIKIENIFRMKLVKIVTKEQAEDMIKTIKGDNEL